MITSHFINGKRSSEIENEVQEIISSSNNHNAIIPLFYCAITICRILACLSLYPQSRLLLTYSQPSFPLHHVASSVSSLPAFWKLMVLICSLFRLEGAKC